MELVSDLMGPVSVRLILRPFSLHDSGMAQVGGKAVPHGSWWQGCQALIQAQNDNVCVCVHVFLEGSSKGNSEESHSLEERVNES